MGNQATTVNEQIALLKQRGLTMDLDDSKVNEILLDIGYYRLGFYWNPFEENRTHAFKRGALFSDAVSLYYLDADLRKIFLNYLYRIEVNFRTKLIYHVSNHYPQWPAWFADSRVMEASFLTSLPNHYSLRIKQNNKVVRNHHKKYPKDDYAPAWKAIEFFSFGNVLAIYQYLKNENVRTLIRGEYGIRKHQKFIEHMKTILLIRNVCSHGGVLFDRHIPKAIGKMPGLTIEETEKHKLSSVIKLVAFYINKISTNRENDFNNEIHAILGNPAHNLVIKELIKDKIGYTIK